MTIETNITMVTTFHKEGLDLYGQRFLHSFEKHVDKKVDLLVYAEDCQPEVDDPVQIHILDAKQELPKLNRFKDKWKDVPKANGQCPFPERRPKDYHKEFKWHAIRFANKVYAVFDACERNAGWCIWIDADTYVHSNWKFEQLQELLPNDKWITYVGRGKGSQTWPECGFYGLNLNNQTCKDFLKEFERYYEDANNGIFTLEEWHDSYVFGTILDKFKKNNPNVLDYSEGIYNKTAKTGGGGHPLINSKLGRYIDHMKGGRKQIGKSLTKDLLVPRQESYWNNEI